MPHFSELRPTWSQTQRTRPLRARVGDVEGHGRLRPHAGDHPRHHRRWYRPVRRPGQRLDQRALT